MDPRIDPEEDQEENEDQLLENKIESAACFLKKRSGQRKKQTDKHGGAESYTQGQKVWVKIYRRSDASQRLTKKIHLVYDGLYQIRTERRPNTYTVEDEDGNSIGIFNSRLLRI